MSKAWCVVGLTMAVLFAGAARADACSCGDVGPACQAFWNAYAVFDGTVLGIAPIVTESTIGDRTRQITSKVVTLAVHRSWKGIEATPQIEVITAADGAACGFDFKIGLRYLIFASRGGFDHRLTVSICSATRLFEPSGDSEQFLVSLGRPAKGGRVFGSVSRTMLSFGYDDGHVGTSSMDAQVLLRGPSGTFETTARSGLYEFTGLAHGSYEVEVVEPEGYNTRVAKYTLEIPNERACARRLFWLAPAGRIAGRLVDATGRPMRRRPVEVTRADATPHPRYGLASVSAYTDLDGFFEIRDLPPGSYIVGLNLRGLPSEYNPYPRVVYPGLEVSPHVVALALGQAADIGTWQIPPPLPIVKIQGSIAWSDGSPAGGVYISLWDVTGEPMDQARGAGGAISDANGRFAIDGRAGRKYTFVARMNNGLALHLSAAQIEAREGLGPLRLVARRDVPR